MAEDANRLKNQLGANDQRKLEEYLGAIRELEVRISRAGEFKDGAQLKGAQPKQVARDYYRNHFQEHAHAMAELLALAFQGDLTRVAADEPPAQSGAACSPGPLPACRCPRNQA